MAAPNRVSEVVPADVRRRDRRDFIAREKLLREQLVDTGLFDTWKEIATYTHPRRVRFYWEDRANSGRKVNDKIINGTAGRAIKIASSGLLTGACSPARPWFRLQFVDPGLRRSDGVRRWLDDAEETTRAAFSQSNFYDTAGTVCRDLPTWGSSAVIQDDDAEDVVRYYHRPIGTWVAACNARGVIDTLYSQVGMTLLQIAEKFGLDTASAKLKNEWTAKRYDRVHPILHVIEPNLDFDPARADRRGKRFRSVWLESTCNESGPPLGEGNGYRNFPALVPRWEVNGDLTYGDAPAFEALGDIKALQKIESLKLRAVHAIVNPAMNFPASMRDNPGATTLPGNANWVPDGLASDFIRPTVQVDPKVIFVQSEAERHEQRIMQAFHADMFLMLSMADGPQKTKREVDEQHEEKMLQLGPTLGKVNGEFLKPAVLQMLTALLRRGLIPAPPAEVQGHVFEIEFVSILAQAQKLLSTAATERFFGFVGNVAGAYPEVLDIVDPDATVRNYGDMVGVPAETLRTTDEVAERRQARAAQKQLEMMAAGAKPAADAASAANLLSQTDVRGDSALNRIIGAIQP